MNNMNITDAKYVTDILSGENSSILATIDEQKMSVPIAEGNRHYDEIMRQVAEGTLTIADAE